ncbi:DUF2254 domain-containing protein [Pseudoxanthomonas dokdonensis]|uniref:DUF2254 domain-containing protein n=1 Tax=Pseudoxanthomonas dokdonensis TaxID=344882 RepID=A0A0R0CKK2_9GAMM|nr:DUF2254 domain-containing protein [Pseudoxanthomonas dokdonensis]KRG70492.1 hypothetical protein ABB29_05245 [Pseudoxanthomonas dokdonensis]
MISNWKLVALRLTRRMWFRATVYCALGVITALVGAFAKQAIPSGLAGSIGAGSVGNILSILAASMLAVTTFSLSTMVAAYGAASSGATPRAAKLLIEDTSAQGALATFIGAFLFSIVGLIALSTGLYGDSGRVILLAATVLVIVLITVTLLRWIEQLSRFGRIAETIGLAENATRAAMRSRAQSPWLGGAAAIGLPGDGVAIEASRVGYVDYLDMHELHEISEEADVDLHVVAVPGTFASPDQPLVVASGTLDEHASERVRSAFKLADSRSFESDPRYGLIVLTEIAQRALSPAINDPGTCIGIIGSVVRLLVQWSQRMAEQEPPEVRYPRVYIPALREDDMFADVFPKIARDGAGMLEVAIRLQKAFAALAETGYAPSVKAAREQARLALARSLQALDFEPDRQALRAVAEQVNGITTPAS